MLGSVEKNMSLFLQWECEQSTHVDKKLTSFSPNLFGSLVTIYICKCHANDSEEFRVHYSVKVKQLAYIVINTMWIFGRTESDSNVF